MDKNKTTDQAANEPGAGATPVVAPTMAPRGMSRRRFASAGLGSAGALLTIVSAPAMAQNATCASPSGTLSGDLHSSHNTPSDVVCSGVSSDFYKGAGKASWAKFHDRQFGGAGMFYCNSINTTKANQKSYSSATLIELIEGRCGFTDADNLGKLFATVWLNITFNKINFIKMNELQTMWNETQNGGYKPSGGSKKWSRREMARYLSRTFT